MFRTRNFPLVIILISLYLTGKAQTFDPFDGHGAEFTVKLERYFPSPGVEQAGRKRLADSVHIFIKGKPWTLSNVGVRLNACEKFLVSLNRHYAYFQLLAYKNKLDTTARSAKQHISELIDALDTRTNQELRRPRFASLAKKNGYPYQYLIRQVMLKAAHELSPADVAVAAQLNDPFLERLTTRYDNLMDAISPVPGRGAIMQNKDPSVRASGMRKFYSVYDQHAEILAATLIDITAQSNAYAKLRVFKSAPEAVYARRLQLPEDSVRSMLKHMTALNSVLKAYQQVQADQVKLKYGLDTAHSWDMNLPSGYSFKPMTYAEVRKLIDQAFKPLGKAYQRSFAWLLEPANGALDIAAGPNRITENTSVGYPGVPTTLYMKSYQGMLGDILRLSHEGGHAIHAQMMSEHLSVPSYSSGPGFLFEAYAMLNELLVLDALKKQAATTEAKAFYTKALLDKLSLEIFTAAEEGSFEQALYDGTAAGRVRDRKDVDSLYSGIMQQYDLFFTSEPERKSEWINKRLLFDDPLYNINYLYAMLLSCRLYQQAHDDPADFARRYGELLKNGFDASANDLIKKYMDFGLENESLLQSTIMLMQAQTDELKGYYQILKRTR
ncbi:M3 family metallopeptidase [Mucilaginibacter pineti]|nr:M3 family metallopeptidase [Mucilaginibacter pineti]